MTKIEIGTHINAVVVEHGESIKLRHNMANAVNNTGEQLVYIFDKRHDFSEYGRFIDSVFLDVIKSAYLSSQPVILTPGVSDAALSAENVVKIIGVLNNGLTERSITDNTIR